jgi:hypothetical protein
MLVNEMSVDEKLVDKMLVNEMPVDEKWPTKCW